MNIQREIKSSFERVAKSLTLNPDNGCNTLVSTTRITAALACQTEEDLIKVFDEGDKHSPYLNIFSRDVSCKRHLKINQRKVR